MTVVFCSCDSGVHGSTKPAAMKSKKRSASTATARS
jgi:hypothetical protein